MNNADTSNEDVEEKDFNKIKNLAKEAYRLIEHRRLGRRVAK